MKDQSGKLAAERVLFGSLSDGEIKKSRARRPGFSNASSKRSALDDNLGTNLYIFVEVNDVFIGKPNAAGGYC